MERTDVEEIRCGFAKWVVEYEKWVVSPNPPLCTDLTMPQDILSAQH